MEGARTVYMLPKLAEAGVIQYDTDTETIVLLNTADQFHPCLEIAAASETR